MENMDQSTIVITRLQDQPVKMEVPRFALQPANPHGELFVSEEPRCIIGSHPSSHLTLEHPTVSRCHAEIRVEENGFRILDSGSANGTRVDGVRVNDAWLRHGATITLGEAELQFRMGEGRYDIKLAAEESFGELVGRSVAMRRLFAVLQRCASVSATVLLEGETGTGKEATAASIHAQSKRADGPFVVVDAGAIPPNLLESELFGHEKGSFTGASATRIGAFEAAHGGTLFLDEIGELPQDLQPKLLRVLEQRRIRRVGASSYRDVDVRIIAATNRTLRASVNDGEFRPDLFYRLAVITVELPPLRQRLDDLELLVDALLRRSGAQDSEVARWTEPGFLAQLSRGSWPGNVRELRNYIERCRVLETVMPLGSDLGPSADVPAPSASLPFQDAKARAVDRFERAYLEELLKEHNDNVSAAARAAEMNRPYLHRLLRKHRLR